MSIRRVVAFVRTEDGKADLPFALCLRCGYFWQPHAGAIPKHCPRCHSPRWWKPLEDRGAYVVRCMCGHLQEKHHGRGGTGACRECVHVEGCGQYPCRSCHSYRPRPRPELRARRKIERW